MNFKSKIHPPTALSSFFVDTSGKPQYSPSSIQKHSCQQCFSEKHNEIFVISNKFSYLCSAFRTYSIRNSFGEMVEWSITTVLKTVVPRGTGGSNPSLSATNAENQQIAKQTPSFAPKNVKSGVFVLFKIIQPLHNKRVAILKESDEKRLIFIYPFSLIFQDFTSS